MGAPIFFKVLNFCHYRLILWGGCWSFVKRFLDALRLCDHQEKDCGTCPHGREAVWHIQVRVSIFQILMEKNKYPSTGLHGYTIHMFAIPLLNWVTSTTLHGHKGCTVTFHHDLTVAVLAIRHNAQSTTILSFLVSWFNVCRPFCLSVLVCFCISGVLFFFFFVILVDIKISTGINTKTQTSA